MAAPLVAIVYGEDELLPLTLAVAYMPLAFALQAPTWIFFRRMDFLRQRLLLAVGPVVTFVFTVALAAAGVGVWSLVIGPAIGQRGCRRGGRGGLALSAAPPPRARRRAALLPLLLADLRVERGDARAAPGPAARVRRLGRDRGGRAITLAYTLTRYADRADHVVASTIYPAICAVRDQIPTLEELFVKSNRAAMIWSVPFCAGIVLFAPDLVDFVLGDEWEPAVVLLQGLAVATALQQLGFNWFSFYRARGDSRPQAVEAAVMAAAFLAFAVPGLALWGATGFVVGRGLGRRSPCSSSARATCTGCCRACGSGRSACAAPLPVVAGAAAALALRLALWGGERPLWQVLCELALFLGVTALDHAAARARPPARVHALPAHGQPDAGRGVRIGLYDPHLATLGGGERYFLTVLEEALRLPDAQVDAAVSRAARAAPRGGAWASRSPGRRSSGARPTRPR